MNMHQIRIFEAIVDKGSFSVAAYSITLNVSKVSQHIALVDDNEEASSLYFYIDLRCLDCQK